MRASLRRPAAPVPSPAAGTTSASGWSGQVYDAWFEPPWGRYAFGAESAALLGALGRLSGRRVLDVGCGTGRFAESMVAEGAHVLGLDVEPTMLAVAAARTAVRVVEGDAHRLPLRPASFEAAVALAVLEFVAHPAGVVAEMWRVTRPGGRVVIGALNRRGPWGVVHRGELGRPPWTAARFLDRQALLALAEPYGRPRLTETLFTPGALPGLQLLGPHLEQLGRLMPRLGAFRVLSIDRS